MIHPFLQEKLETIRLLMQQHRVVRGYLFGSGVTTHFNTDSDVDVLVDVDANIEPAELGTHLWDLQFELENALGRKVDLFTSRALRNPIFIQRVESTKQLVYE